MLSLTAVLNKVQYAGPKRFLVSDGGSAEHELDVLRQVLKPHKHKIAVTDNLSAMLNVCAELADDVWFVTLDDFVPWMRFDITPDVRFLLENPDVGAIRMGRLAFWENAPGEKLYAELRGMGGQHWWVFDPERTTHPYTCAVNTTLYHRRFWDFYGDIPAVPPDRPGEAEIEGARRFRARPGGPRIAVPMRFGQDGGDDFREPIWQLPSWRTPAYSAAGGGRWV